MGYGEMGYGSRAMASVEQRWKVEDGVIGEARSRAQALGFNSEPEPVDLNSDDGMQSLLVGTCA